MSKPSTSPSQKNSAQQEGRAGPGRVGPGSQNLDRVPGLQQSPCSGTTASAEQVDSLRSRPRAAWTGPCSPLILGSRVGRTHGMLPMEFPMEETCPENLSPLFRSQRWSRRDPVPAAEHRDQEQEKALLAGLLSPSREQ